MEVQGSSCNKVNIDFKKLLGLNAVDDVESLKKVEKSLAPQKWKELEQHLAKHLTPEQAQRAMLILGGLRQDATEQDELNASVSFSA